jgi:DNA adenine methylase
MPKPLANYIGGKQQLALQLIQLMPPHYRYIEAFAGMLSVFLVKPKAQENIINDLNNNIITLFEVARDNPEVLMKMVELTPFSTKQYEQWHYMYFEDKASFYKLSKIKQALVFYYLIRCSYSSQYVTQKNIETFSVINAATWGNKNMLENIRSFSKFTQGVVFANMDYKEIIRKYAVKDTFVYSDAPYTMAQDRQYYELGFTTQQHVELRDTVLTNHRETGAEYMLSYDDHEDIKQLYSVEGFYISVIKDVFQACNYSEDGGKVKKNELVITTYNPQDVGLFAHVR